MRKWHPNEDSDSELAQIVSEQKMLDDGFEDGIRAEMVESNWNDDILLVIKCVPRRAKIMRKIAIACRGSRTVVRGECGGGRTGSGGL